MQRVAVLAVFFSFMALGAAADESFEEAFEDVTLRIDYHHTGDAEREFVAIDRIYRQGRWAGPTKRLIDPFPFGRYLAEARDSGNGRLLWSKGYDSYFGEYKTTARASDGELRTFHETVLMPAPKKSVEITFSARGRDGTTTVVGRVTIDPQSKDISTEAPASPTIVVESHLSGPPHGALDIAIVGEGYTSAEIDSFKSDLARASKVLLGHQPFASNAKHINIRGVLMPSHDTGCDEPTRGRYRDTAVGATFNSLGSERYLLTGDNRQLRDIAANVPYDALVIMVNHDRYGGGGIYNLFCTFTAKSKWADYLLLHEFGHSFAGLADEYYSSDVAYNDFYPRGYEPVEPNITAELHPMDIDWVDLMTTQIPIPTPWDKETFDARDSEYQKERRILNEEIADAARKGATEAELETLRKKEERHAAEHAEWVEQFLGSSRWAGMVGAFEGAGYSSTGLYRPALDCLMFSRRAQPFCPVCAQWVEKMIRRYAE